MVTIRSLRMAYRLQLVGKPLVGFQTKRWATVDADGAVKGRTGTKVGTKTAPIAI